MPNPKKARTITLELGKAEIPLRRFKEAVSAFFDLLESVSRETSPEHLIKWNISVQKGSARVIAHFDEADRKAAAPIFKVLPTGLSELEAGGIQEPPAMFSERAIRAARRLSVVRDRGAEAIPVSLIIGTKRAEITANTAQTANDLVEAAYQSYGSVEGKLIMLSDEEGFKFAVHQRLFDRRITCTILDDPLAEEAIGAFRHRVRVQGRIQYNRIGNPVSVTVANIFKFPPNSELPSVQEMKGILSRRNVA